MLTTHGMCSAPSTGGALQKSGGEQYKIFPAKAPEFVPLYFQFGNNNNNNN